jgi:nicotinamidase-related amidase
MTSTALLIMDVQQGIVDRFAGSDLDVLLRARRTEHLVLAGIATSGVVLSTLCQAACPRPDPGAGPGAYSQSLRLNTQ